MPLLISGATIIDGVADKPIDGKSIWIEGRRIKEIVNQGQTESLPSTEVIDARGKYVIPGLMDANVHLLLDVRLENLARNQDRYGDLIAEAAQVALRSGLTTVFDTWGPRQSLQSVRDKINSYELPGSRIYCAGNIVGLDGPLSVDFFPKTPEVASGLLIETINSLWVENVGPELRWMTPEEVSQEVRLYVGKGIDFVKYASSDHRGFDPAFLAFSQEVQGEIVAEAHRASLTAQAHTTSVESLRMAIEAGADIIQHCNFTGPRSIPNSTLELLVQRNTASTVFPFTQRRLGWAKERCPEPYSRHIADANGNVQQLIQSGATLLLATDGGVFAPEIATDPAWGKFMPGEDNLFELGQGHIHWLKAMEELGFSPMAALKAATLNIAIAYQKNKDLGTLEPGKIADLLILDKNPLQAADNYRSIYMVLKDGAIVDRTTLPQNAILTKTAAEPTPEMLAYRARRHAFAGRYPLCC